VFSGLASRYVEYFSPGFLFFGGDRVLHHHTGFGGELFRFLIPMVLAGVYCLIRFSGVNQAIGLSDWDFWCIRRRQR